MKGNFHRVQEVQSPGLEAGAHAPGKIPGMPLWKNEQVRSKTAKFWKHKSNISHF